MKLKNLLIALMMIIGSTLMAQDKFEQAIVNYYAGILIEVSIEGKEFESTKIKLLHGGSSDATPLLSKLALMREQGWEVWNAQQSLTNGGSFVTTYFLRRKLK